MQSPQIKRLQRRTKIYRVTGYIFIGLQAISYLSLMSSPEKIEGPPGYKFGYYLGSSLWLILALIFFLLVYRNTKKVKTLEGLEQIESIGKTPI